MLSLVVPLIVSLDVSLAPHPLTCRRQRDTQKLSQAILMANEQRLMALRIPALLVELLGHLLCLFLLCRRQRDTQKLSQAILMANDQRLMALRIHEHQEQQLHASRGLFSSTADSSSMLGSCERAASAADLLRMAAAGASGKRGSARVTMSQQGGGGLAGRGFGNAAAATGGSNLAAAAAGDEVAVRSAASNDLKDVPFEMLVLEVLLDATAGGLCVMCYVMFVLTRLDISVVVDGVCCSRQWYASLRIQRLLSSALRCT
jgi:hypothetical protein